MDGKNQDTAICHCSYCFACSDQGFTLLVGSVNFLTNALNELLMIGKHMELNADWAR